MEKKRKKSLSLTMAFIMFFSVVCGVVEPAKVLAANSGTPTSPYTVSEALDYVQKTYPATGTVAATGIVIVEGYIVDSTSADPKGIILADDPSTLATSADSKKLLNVLPYASNPPGTFTQNIETLKQWAVPEKKGQKVRVTGTWRFKPGATYGGKTGISTIGTVKDAELTIVPADSPITPPTPPTVKPITGLTIPATAEVDVNKTTKLSFTLTPADTTDTVVNWTSSDDTIATVSADGTVTGKTGGKTVTITATSAANSAIKAQCTVTVKAAEPAITIAEARAKAANSSVKVSGVVTYIDATRYYIQDSTGAIVLDVTGAKLAKGDKVTAIGTISSYKELLTVKLAAATDVVVESNSNTLPDPVTVTVADASSEKYEAQRVKVTGLIGTINTAGNTALEDSTGIANLFKIPALTGIKEGDYVDVIAIASQYSAAGANTGYQLRVASSSDVKTNPTPDTTKPVLTHTPITEGSIYRSLVVTANAKDDRRMAGVKLYYREKGQTEYVVEDMPDAADLYKLTISKDKLSVKGLEYYLEAKDIYGNVATSPADISSPYFVNISTEDIEGPSILKLIPQADSNVGNNFKPTISVQFRDDAGVNPLETKMFLDNVDITAQMVKLGSDKVEYTPVQDLTKGVHTAKIQLTDIKGNVTTKEWSFTVGDEEYNFYFGQLHSHTNISDGQGSLSEAYTWARDNGKADFFAVTDHSNSLDNDKDCNIADGSKSPEWVDAHATADKFNENGKFVAMYGYEMTWSGSTGGWGHINTFNTPGFESRTNAAMDLKKYYETLPTQPQSISQLNHPGKTFGDFADFGYYTEAADKVVDLVEVGNGEGPVRSTGYFPSYEYYTRALDRGWHVAPTNNQDNHKGAWVTANAARTVILAPELTRDSMYEAMSAKRVYATEDSNLKLMYKVNGKVMGASLDNPNSLNVNISINDPDSTDKVGKVSIIADGGIVVDSKSFNSNNASWDLALDPQFSYYYVRVDEEDGDIAVSAPVWTGSVAPVGLSKVETAQPINITNEPIEISAEIFNNGVFSLMNSKVEFFKNEMTDENKIGECIIPRIAGSNKGTAKITWTPDKVGNYTIHARTSLPVEDSPRVFTESTKLQVMNKEDVVQVVIDGAHANQYITGDYPGKYSALKQMLADMRGVLKVNTSAITDDTLKDAKLLILTDPLSKALGDIKPSFYSDAEVAAIKKFVEAGGNIIVTSKADYGDGAGDYGSAAQGNKVLKAIGTNLRLNDDEVVDNIENGGASQPFRLYLNDYAGTKYNLTKDVPKDQKYSFYSGCSVILATGGNDANVDYLVKGHATTETLDSDTQKDNTTVAKGEVNALAAEVLPNGSKVIVAGSTFFSDFEVTADNTYSNVQIAKNALNWMAPLPQAEVKSIKDVRIDANGDGVPDNLGKRFAIEGRVTAQSVAVLPSNAFFDVMYVQDGTAGITVFGVSQTAVKLGQRVRVTGYVDQYQGDGEIQIADEKKDLQILDDTVEIVAPTEMSTGDSMLEKNEGTLVKTRGIVTKIDNQNIYVDDNLNDNIAPARAYVEGYIWDGVNENNKGKWNQNIKVGETVSVIGLASEDPEGHRLRVRNTSEIVLLDVKAPEITVNGANDGSVYNTAVLPVISVNEGSYTATLNGKPYDGAAISGDGQYVLEITAKDAAGNESKKTIIFSIDSLAPEIIILGVVDGGIYKNNVTITANAVDNSTITMTLNDKAYDSKEISEDGTYVLAVVAKDKAGNETKKVVSFTIDKTAPVITIVGVENNKSYKMAVTPTVKVDDSKATVTVTLNGKPYDNKSIDKNGQYRLVVTATDKAGNNTEKTVDFTVALELISTNTDAVVDTIKDSAAGSTTVIKIAEDNKVDASILKAIAGTDKTVVFEKDGVTWSFNGKDINHEMKNLDLSAKVGNAKDSVSPNRDAIAAKVKGENVMVITFAENGVLPGAAKVTVNLGSAWANKNNLFVYYYNPQTKKVEKIDGNLKADSKGNVTFTITHCSDYFVADKDLIAAGVIPKTGSPVDMNLLIGLGVLLVAGGLYVAFRRKTVVK